MTLLPSTKYQVPKTIFINTLAQLVAKGIAVLLTLLSTTCIIRVGGSELFGGYTKALALIAIGFTAIDFGLNAEAVRSMTGSPVSRRQVLADTLLSRLLLSFLAILILNLVVHLLPGGYSGEIKRVFWLGSLAIIFQGLYSSSNAWFQRHLQYWKSSLAVVFGTTISTGLTFYFVFTSPSLSSLLLSSTLGYFSMGVISLLLLRSHLPASYSLSKSLAHLRRSLSLGAILILSVFATKLDVIILGVLRSSLEVGEYGFAYRVFDVALVLPIFAMNALYPLLVSSSAKHKASLVKTSLKYLLITGILGTLILYPLAPLIYLVKPSLELSVASFRLLILSLPLFYVTAPLMWQLIEARRERPLLALYALAALTNGLLNLVFIPHFGALASAAITGITELFILLGLLYLHGK